MKKMDRCGEINKNNYGSIMEIIKYTNANDINVYFKEYDWIKYHATYQHFKSGDIKCPLEKRYYNKGYLGIGDYEMSDNGKFTAQYKTWYNMLTRCYNPKVTDKFKSYISCEVCDKWLNFQNFAEWYDDNYYNVNDEIMCLDKDILKKGNKIYSPDTCIFVPQRINTLFLKSNESRGELPIGVSARYYNKNIKYQANCHSVDEYKLIYLGTYDTIIEAFEAYKLYKEAMIKQLADEYKQFIPKILYDTMKQYVVEIID